MSSSPFIFLLNQNQNRCYPRFTPPAPSFTPSFDITENPNAYHLIADLPGLSSSDINIEFSAVQTLSIRSADKKDFLTKDATNEDSSNKDGANEASNSDDDTQQTSSRNSYQASVEDEFVTVDPQPKAQVEAKEQPQPQSQTQSQPEPRYWIKERKSGVFSRSFSFKEKVQEDAVKAELKNGVLSIWVPKVQRGENRRIVVS